jgi:hypothetical protein
LGLRFADDLLSSLKERTCGFRFAVRFKVLAKRLLSRIGIREDTGLLPVAVLIGVLTAVAAVAFHELINLLVQNLYKRHDGAWLYRGGLWLLVVIPAAGGLCVGLISRFLLRSQGGHGVVDVIESVMRTRGFVRPITAIEKIITAAITIGTGGSTGAEGPIVQIGAAVSSAVGTRWLFPRQRMPLLVGCGTAAGISSIFHAHRRGLFTWKSFARLFRPCPGAGGGRQRRGQCRHRSLVRLHRPAPLHRHLLHRHANARARLLDQLDASAAIRCSGRHVRFDRRDADNAASRRRTGVYSASQARPAETCRRGRDGRRAGRCVRSPFRLADGPGKAVPYGHYPMPAFFGDGYGVIKTMLDGSFGSDMSISLLLAMLVSLLILKMLATTLTLASGGSAA